MSTSKIGDQAGEGLFAKKSIKKDQLVCLFNGIRHFKKGRVVRIGANDEEWSDYRIVLGKATRILGRGSGSGCAGCTVAHPLFRLLAIFIRFQGKKEV